VRQKYKNKPDEIISFMRAYPAQICLAAAFAKSAGLHLAGPGCSLIGYLVGFGRHGSAWASSGRLRLHVLARANRRSATAAIPHAGAKPPRYSYFTFATDMRQ